MDKLVRTHLRAPLKKGVKREYYQKTYFIYDPNELEIEGIEAQPWFLAKIGEWGTSDDGYTSVCIKRREYFDKRGRRQINYVYPFGQAFYRPDTETKGKLHYMDHVTSGDFSNVTTKPHWEQKKGKTQYKNFINVYVHQLMNGCVDFSELGKVFDKDEPMPSVKARSLLKKDYIKEMIDEKLKGIMSERGLSEDTYFNWVDQAAKMAIAKKDAGNLLRAANELGDVLHIKDKNQSPDGADAEITQLSAVDKALEIEEATDVEYKEEPV